MTNAPQRSLRDLQHRNMLVVLMVGLTLILVNLLAYLRISEVVDEEIFATLFQVVLSLLFNLVKLFLVG